MRNPKINFIFIYEVSRLKWSEFLNEVLKVTLLKMEIGIYSRARPTIYSLLVNILFCLSFTVVYDSNCVHL